MVSNGLSYANGFPPLNENPLETCLAPLTLAHGTSWHIMAQARVNSHGSTGSPGEFSPLATGPTGASAAPMNSPKWNNGHGKHPRQNKANR